MSPRGLPIDTHGPEHPSSQNIQMISKFWIMYCGVIFVVQMLYVKKSTTIDAFFVQNVYLKHTKGGPRTVPGTVF